MSELLSMWNHQVVSGLAQAAAAIALCLAVVLLCRRFAVRVERETVLSLARGFVQMVAVGVLLAAVLHGSLPIAVCILAAMTVAAAVTAGNRAAGASRPRLLAFCAIAAGGGVTIAVMLASGTMTSDLIVLVPVGSMIIANAMNACAQAMERFHADVLAHVGQIEAGLALGADPANDGGALCAEFGLCQPAAAPRYAEVARAGVDSGRDGRHAGVGRQPDLRRHFSIYHRRDDLVRVGDCGPGRNLVDAGPGFLQSRSASVPP